MGHKMQNTQHAQLVLNAAGRIVGLALGSHPGTQGQIRPTPLASRLCATSCSKEAVLERLEAGDSSVKAPNLLEAARLTRNLDEVRFSGTGSAEPKAILWFAGFDLHRFNGQLDFPAVGRAGADGNVVAAWDDEGFAVCVRGEQYVRALQQFHQAIQERKVVFAEWFFTHEKFGGMVLADETLVDERDRMVIRTLQRESEESLKRELADAMTA